MRHRAKCANTAHGAGARGHHRGKCKEETSVGDGWMETDKRAARKIQNHTSFALHRSTCGHSSSQVWRLQLHAAKPPSLAAAGHCPPVFRRVETEDYSGIWSEIECCLLCPAQSLGVVFEMRDKTRKSPSGHRAMIFSSITMRDHFIPICCWEEEIKACNHLAGLPFAFQNLLCCL